LREVSRAPILLSGQKKNAWPFAHRLLYCSTALKKAAALLAWQNSDESFDREARLKPVVNGDAG